ncbi:MAG: cytochrome P450 [Parvibaculaceae bacterium]
MHSLAIDQAIVDPKTFAREETYHDLFTQLRREDPVHWTEPGTFRPFWTISKHTDIMEVEKQNDIFINDRRLTLQSIDVENRIIEKTGSTAVFRTLVSMDNPDHRTYRSMTQAWFMPPNLKKLDVQIKALAHEYIARLEGFNGQCDFVTDVAVWYPLRVIMTILGGPPEDEALMLKLTQEVFGSTDPDMKAEDSDVSGADTAQRLFAYFREITEDRRRNPRDDVASIIANATINGELVSEYEALSYYVIVATAGHDTTSSTVAGGLLALMQNPDQMAKLRANPALLPSAIDEMIRWTTPVKHFFRTATQDYELRGKKIKAGDNLLMCYWSANRDEDAFDDPFAFRIDRTPNKHLSFGYGAHLCLGQHLAKMEIRSLYEELLSRLDHIELTGEPSFVEATFVSGLKHLPVRFKMKQRAA